MKRIVAALTGCFLILAVNEVFGLPPLMTPAASVQPGMVGSWRHGSVTLVVTADGAVSGSYGERSFTGARLTGNRSWFGKAMHLRTDYFVRGYLDDGREFRMPLNFTGDAWPGAITVAPDWKNSGRAFRLRRV